MSKRNSIEKDKKTFVLKSERILNKCYVESCIVFCLFLSFFVVCTKTNDESIDAYEKVNIMSFWLCAEIYVVSFLYFDTMTEYQSEVMSFLLWIIYVKYVSLHLPRHFMGRQIVFSCIKSKSYIDECIEVTFSMSVVYDLRKSKSTNKSRSGKAMPS